MKVSHLLDVSQNRAYGIPSPLHYLSLPIFQIKYCNINTLFSKNIRLVFLPLIIGSVRDVGNGANVTTGTCTCFASPNYNIAYGGQLSTDSFKDEMDLVFDNPSSP